MAGWKHGRVVAGPSRVYSVVDVVTESGPVPDIVDQGILSVSTDGVVTTTAVPSFKGFLSADKQLLVATQTVGQNEHLLSVLVRSGGAFTTADLAGTWTYANLAAAVGAGTWARGTVTFDASGRATFGLQTDSGGGSGSPDPMTLAVAADGTVTEVPAAAFDGKLLMPAKDVLVATETHEPGVYGMIVAIR